MNAVCLVFGIMFFMVGILFACGKLHEHLKEWKAMPQEEKNKIKIIPLCRNIGSVIALCGLILFVSGIWSAFREHAFTWCMIFWFVLAVADTYLIGKKNRYIQK